MLYNAKCDDSLPYKETGSSDRLFYFPLAQTLSIWIFLQLEYKMEAS